MRIIGSLEHPRLKITVFKMNNRISIKFESDLNEQIYKFRTDEILKNMDDVKEMVDRDFLQSVEQQFKGMARLRNSVVARRWKQRGEEEFDDII